MTQPVLVRGFTSNNWILGFRIVSVLALLIGLVCLAVALSGERDLLPIALLVLGGAIVTLCATEISAWQGRSLRRWVEDFEQGFRVTDSEGTHDFLDDDVIAYCWYYESHFDQGLLTARDRKFSFWTMEDPRPCEFVNRIKTNDSDPLDELIRRLADRLQARAEASLDQGRPVAGDNWTFDRRMFQFNRPTGPESFRVEEFVTMDIVDQEICLWRETDELPAVKISIKSRNADLLLRLLGPIVAEQAEKRPPRPHTQSDHMGRVWFERKPTAATIYGCLIFGILLIPGGMCLIVFPQDPIAAVMGLCCIAGGLGCIYGAWHCKNSAFRCTEFGVVQSNPFSTKRLRYTEVMSFTYGATRQYYNGAYVGTTFVLNFEPWPTSGGQAIHYSVQLQQADQELDTLRDQISKIIAGRMAQALDQGQPVQWTQNLIFRPEGLEFRPAGWIGRKDPILIPYRDIFNFDIQTGMFYVWRPGETKACVEEPCAAHNFFPGFFLLVAMFTPQNPDPGPQG